MNHIPKKIIKKREKGSCHLLMWSIKGVVLDNSGFSELGSERAGSGVCWVGEHGGGAGSLRETHLTLSLAVTQGTCVPILALPWPSKVTRQEGTQQGLDRKMQLYIFLRHHEKPVEVSVGHGGPTQSQHCAVILEPTKIKSVVSIFSFSICHKVMGPDSMILAFWMVNFKPVFSLSSLTLIKRLFSSSSLSAIRVFFLHIWGYWY